MIEKFSLMKEYLENPQHFPERQEYSPEIQKQIENLAKSSLEAFIPYHGNDNLSVTEEIHYIYQIANVSDQIIKANLPRQFWSYITLSQLAIKSIKFHIMYQNLDRALELYKKFISCIWLNEYDNYSEEIAIFFLNASFKYDEQIINVINNQLGNVLCKDILKITRDYLPAKPLDLAEPLAPIVIAVETIQKSCPIQKSSANNFFWKIGAEWSLSLSPPQIEWASFAKSRIEDMPSTRSLRRQLDEKIARARAKMPAAIAMKDQ